MPPSREIDPSESLLTLFGYELRRYRLAAGLSQEQLGRETLASGSLVGMIETAQRVAKLDFVERADEALETGALLYRIWRLLGRELHPSYFRPFAHIEANATLLRQFEPLAVPGLLQTQGYARAVYETTRPDYAESQVEEFVAARMERRAILDGPDAPTLVVLLGEGVLSRMVGSRAILRTQLDALLDASKRAKVIIQVVPETTGAAAGLAGMFTLATISSNGGEVVYFETVATGQLVDRADDVAACATAFEVLRAQLTIARGWTRATRPLHQLETQDA